MLHKKDKIVSKHKKKSQSQSEIHPLCPPTVNQKPIPIHFEYRSTKEIESPKQPLQHWGCIVPERIKKLEKTLYKTVQKFPSKTIEKKVKKQKSSQIILLKYLKRKKRRMFRQPQGIDLLETFYNTQRNLSPLKQSSVKLGELTPAYKNFFKEQNQTIDSGLNIEKRKKEDTIIRQRKKEQKSERITQISNWNSWRDRSQEQMVSGVKKLQPISFKT